VGRRSDREMRTTKKMITDDRTTEAPAARSK
jgi:hypothetical protein